MALTTDRVEEIETLAKDVLSEIYKSLEDVTPPIDLGKILKSHGIKLKTGEFKSDDISGAYSRKDKTIYVSDNESYSRQAVTAAHELGHYLLHQDKPQEIFYRLQAFQFGKQTEKKEQEADWFAATLLMPSEAVHNLWPVVKNVHKIAEIFGVSYSAARWRLKKLNLG